MTRIASIAFALLLAVSLAAPGCAAELPDFTGIVEQVSPAVVNISATRNARPAATTPGAPGEDEIPEIFRRYFGLPGMPGMPGITPMPRERISMGTGFFISSDGYVLTNHHVVDGSDEIYVRLTDRRELKATLVGSDEQSDIALLKLEGRGFPFLKPGDSKQLKPGQWVVAIGSPFGFDHSVTAGIVSAVGRASMDRSQQYVPFIQTDVAINRGNSGGPLLTPQGEVVGINSQIFSNTGGFMGVSFAIPIEVAMRSADQLKSQGYVSRGLLGVNIQDVTRDLAESMKLPRASGALVSGFSEGSAARRAGIQIGDVIVAYGDTEIVASSDLPPLVGATTPGTKVQLRVIRDGKTLEIPVVVGELPRSEATASTGGARGSAAQAGNPLGLLVEDLDQTQRDALELEGKQGVVITRITSDAGRRAGLREGDVVLMVGRTPVASAQQFNELVASAKPGSPVMLLIRRGDQASFFTVTPRAEQG